MTNEVKSVAQGLREIAESGRIGRPVFVRWTATFAAGAENSSDLAEAALSDVSSIFGTEPESTSSMGDGESGNVSVFCRWAGGQTALIATGVTSPDQRPGFDIALIGSEGAAYHRDDR
jgi:hypothetical protein